MIVPFTRRGGDDEKPVHCQPVAVWLKICMSDIITMICMAVVLMYLIWGISFTLKLYRSARRRRRAGQPLFRLPFRLTRYSRWKDDSVNGTITQFTGLLSSPMQPSLLRKSPISEEVPQTDPYRFVTPSLEDSLLIKHSLLEFTAIPAPVLYPHEPASSVQDSHRLRFSFGAFSSSLNSERASTPASASRIQHNFSYSHSGSTVGLGFGDTVNLEQHVFLSEHSELSRSPSSTSPPSPTFSWRTTPLVEMQDPVLTSPPRAYAQSLHGQGRGRRSPTATDLGRCHSI